MGYVIENADRVMEKYPEMFLFHHDVLEREKLILPILALIRASPKALSFFLSEQWDPFQLNIRHGSNYTSKFFLDLISEAITDLGRNVLLPENSLVQRVQFNHFEQHVGISNKREAESALLSLELPTFDMIFFDIRYTAMPVCHKGTYHITTENDQQPLGSPLWVEEPSPDSYAVTIRFKDGPLCIIIEQIRNNLDFIQWIKSDDPVAECIYQNLSFRLQNLLYFYPVERGPSKVLIKMVITELNRVIKRVNLADTISKENPSEIHGRPDESTGCFYQNRYHKYCSLLIMNSSMLCHNYPELFIDRAELQPPIELVKELLYEQMEQY